MMRTPIFVKAGLVLLLLGASVHAQAQAWPSKPVKIVVITSAGGFLDALSRMVAERLTRETGQPVIVENRTGAGGNIGTDYVAKAAPDGHTLLTTGFNHAINQTLLPNPGFDYQRDLSPVTGLTDGPMIILAHPSLEAGDIAGLIALAKKKPGAISFGSSAIGTPGHVAGELLNAMAGIQLVYVPYKGGAPALVDNVGGQIQLSIVTLPPAVPLINSGRLKALGVTGPKRSPMAPNIPTVAEAGLPGYDVNAWICLLTTAGVPEAIIGRINAEVRKIISLPEMRDALLKQGAEPWLTTPAELGSYMKAEAVKWADVLRRTNIKAN